MTARALELIAGADVIVYDRLIPATALDGARADARLLYAGKEGGGPSVSQEEIDALLVEHGRAGESVVRLKGGDPFVFGRGGEEAEALRAAGIPFEVVPGVTAGVAAPAYAGIPVTHRDAASAVAFVTGHEDPAKPESALDWRALAAFPGTLVVYMGVRRLAAIAEQLIAGGRDAEQPAAVIERGTFPGQRVVTATLATHCVERRGAGHPRARDRGVRRGRGTARAPALVRGSATGGRQRRGHPRAGPGERARIAAARARRRGRRGAGDPDLAAGGLAARSAQLRPGVPDQPQRRAAAARAHGLCGRRCARTVGRPDRGDRSRHRRGAARARPDRRRRARAVRRRGAGRGAGRRAGLPGARGARRRGSRRAPGRAARARRRGRRRGPV